MSSGVSSRRRSKSRRSALLSVSTGDSGIMRATALSSADLQGFLKRRRGADMSAMSTARMTHSIAIFTGARRRSRDPHVETRHRPRAVHVDSRTGCSSGSRGPSSHGDPLARSTFSTRWFLDAGDEAARHRDRRERMSLDWGRTDACDRAAAECASAGSQVRPRAVRELFEQLVTSDRDGSSLLIDRARSASPVHAIASADRAQPRKRCRPRADTPGDATR